MQSPEKAERRPSAGGGALDITRGDGDTAIISAAAHIPPATSPERELRAWAAAVGHLHAAGLPAAVPPFAAAWLRRRGVRADWTAAA